MGDAAPVVGSPSIAHDDYWWYRARAELLGTVLAPYLTGAVTTLDVGSADGPSVRGLRGSGLHVSLDLDPRGLGEGGVCASAMRMPFRDGTFDVVSAFDVVEHCEPEADALAELVRVLRPGGRLLVAVPAYEWAWTHHDDDNGHHRRYTRRRLAAALVRAGVRVERATYLFAGTFPAFAAQRLVRRAVERDHRQGGRLAPGEVPGLPRLPAPVERAMLALCRVDRRLLARRDLPFGSSVVAASVKPG